MNLEKRSHSVSILQFSSWHGKELGESFCLRSVPFRDNSEIYILNNKKFKWRYYYYGQENRVGLPQYSASFPPYSDKVDL